MSDKKENHIGFFSEISMALRYFFPIAWKEKPFFFVLYGFDIIVKTVQPFIDIFFVKYLINELLGDRNVSVLIGYVLVLVVGNALCYLFMNLISENIGKYDDWFVRYFEMQISVKSMDMDFYLTENTDALDQSEKARTGMQWYSGGVNGITSAFSNLIKCVLTILGSVAVIITATPLLMLVIIAVVTINTFLNMKVNEIRSKHFSTLSNLNRVFGYIYWGLLDFRYGKDIRLYGAAEMMLKKADNANSDMTNKWHHQASETNKLNVIDVIVSALRDGFTYFYLGYLAVTKVITVGDFTMLTGAGGTFQGNLKSLMYGIQDLQNKCMYANEFVKFMQYPSVSHQGEHKPQQTDRHIIEFKNVSFKYPNAENYVLKNVSVKLEAGEHLSVVGLNGAGKTTFIKLLCRLYDVNDGEILLDGINIKEYDYEEYVKLFSVVFQDFKLFSFSVKENIALEKADESESEILEYAKLAGLEEKLNVLDDGINTPVFKQFDDNGFEPSGGEQQKIAIARALYKNSPVVILDEPTAALDPIAEYEIYRQFDMLVGGKTAVYISHRLSSCKFCDKIAVFSEGTVKEYGTHDELSELENGIYAEMFAAQAQYYC